MDDRQPDALTDTAIDREIRTVLDVEPSPEFLARVRTRIAHQPVASRVGWSWVFAGAVAVVVVLAVMVSVSRRQEVTADLKVGTTEISPAATTRTTGAKIGITESPAADLKVGTTDTVTVAAAVVPTFRSARAEESPVPEVLISPHDARAFQGYVTSLRNRRFELAFDETPFIAETPIATALTIPPITIEPLNAKTPDEGVFQ